ncbi:uncharacterized protein L969DRAFT_96087 [Mixia osmundae IAM 14324]|uniref:Uncharacterized protein n=1 Tax=Mixia osmundae (strain CBS 9802 / IAM 14324 / JCM 22182 / KY 12970) TaxID=764103 RepID=G7DS29_MIXOS|nr:uncharacterized protein L969DRAFT_96087 [Mixia osmundae IAM 14324]KEI37557.1 hypothetical protein L969DRAFT_96087 [Mixia osmundae IAM 14324]GAA93389.1 hypothetical protein E5Q_00029 [Mixia osmundae IAM 14324]
MLSPIDEPDCSKQLVVDAHLLAVAAWSELACRDEFLCGLPDHSLATPTLSDASDASSLDGEEDYFAFACADMARAAESVVCLTRFAAPSRPLSSLLHNKARTVASGNPDGERSGKHSKSSQHVNPQIRQSDAISYALQQTVTPFESRQPSPAPRLVLPSADRRARPPPIWPMPSGYVIPYQTHSQPSTPVPLTPATELGGALGQLSFDAPTMARQRSGSTVRSESSAAPKSRRSKPASENPNLTLLRRGSFPPVQFPPQPYSGDSPFEVQPEPKASVYQSQVDRLPVIEARLERIEASIQQLMHARGQQTLRATRLETASVQDTIQQTHKHLPRGE